VQGVDESTRYDSKEPALRLADIELAQQLLIRCAGLDLSDPQATRTPERFVRALKELTTPDDFEFTVFDNNGYDEMVTAGEIPFRSLCMHHVLVFEGKAWVAYIPDRWIAGLSKIARAVEFFSQRLQTQEQLTNDIAECIEQELKPVGVAVVLRASHSCMSIRGARSVGALTTTACMKGVFSQHEKTAKAEFLQWVNGK
jgi:GTP cyclohydrolase I